MTVDGTASENLVYKRATPDDSSVIKEFLLTDFYKGEPTNRALKVTLEDFAPVIDDILSRSITSGYNTVVFDSTTDRVVAVRLCSVMTRPENAAETKAEAESYVFGRTGQVLEDMINTLHSAFWDLVDADVTKVLHREIVSVASTHQRRGIASTLQRLHIEPETLKADGIQGIVSETSSLANQRLLARDGFLPLKTILHSEMRDADGNPRLQCDDGTDRMVLNFKRLL